MKKILAIFTLFAGVASAQSFIRTHTIVSDNSTFPSPANVEWMSGESVRFEITAKNGNFYIPLSNGVAPVLKMWSGNVITQLYAQKTGTIYSAGSGKLYVDLLANEANITPTGAYNYAIGVYDGTQYMGVVAQGRAIIRGHPFGASVGYVGAFNAFPYVPSNDAAYLNAITNIVAGTNITVSRSGRQVTINSSASGGGSGTFTNLQWGTNNNTAQAIIIGESNIVFRSAGGSNYVALARNLTGDFTFNGAINANDNIEIANTKHLRFQDGGGTNTVHLAATAGRLIITGALDIITGQAVPATINGSQIALNSDVSLRLASNVWAAADSTTNYVSRTGDTMTGNLIITNASITVKSDSINAQFSDARGAAGVLLQTGSPSAATNTYGVVKLQDSGPSAGYGTLYFDSRVSPTGLWIKASGTNRWNVWDQRNDGAGSGLDADLLDGLDSTNFALLSSSPTFAGTVTAANFSGNGAGLTNVTASALNGNAAQSLLTNNLVIQGAAPITVTTAVGGNITTATVGIAASALIRNQRGFIFRGSEGSLQAAFVEPIHIPPGGDYISVRTATNALTVNNFVQTLSTITATSIAYVAFNHMMTGAIPWVVVANQPVGDYVFSAYDYSGAQSVAITQTVSAAGTWYYTNLPLSINAFVGKIEARVRTTNSANIYQGGVDMRVSP